jgi:rhodanese-related sulfurtransferase
MTTQMQSAIEEVDAAQVKRWLDAGEAVLIDVREPDEHRRERIAGAKLVPKGDLSPEAVGTDNGKRLVLHCYSGARSMEAARALAGSGCGRVYSVKGGFRALKQSGLTVHEDRKAPIGVQRQVQLTIGIGVLAFTALGAFVNPWFLIGAAFFGAGLTFAGASGTCGLAVMLGKMPWNRVRA